MAAVLSVPAAILHWQAMYAHKKQGLQNKQLWVHMKSLATHPKVVVDKSRCFPLQNIGPCQSTECAGGSDAHLSLAESNG